MNQEKIWRQTNLLTHVLCRRLPGYNLSGYLNSKTAAATPAVNPLTVAGAALCSCHTPLCQLFQHCAMPAKVRACHSG